MDPLRPGELLGFVRVPLLHAPQTFLKATGRTGPGRASPPSRSSSTRPGAGCAARSARSRRCRCGPLEAEQWVAGLIDWDGERSLAPEACTAFGEYVAAACIPDPHRPRTVELPAAARRTPAAAYGGRTVPPSAREGAGMTDEPQRSRARPAAPGPGSRVPGGGDYDPDQTMHVSFAAQLPPEPRPGEDPLAAPGPGDVTAAITDARTRSSRSATDPAATGRAGRLLARPGPGAVAGAHAAVAGGVYGPGRAAAHAERGAGAGRRCPTARAGSDRAVGLRRPPGTRRPRRRTAMRRPTRRRHGGHRPGSGRSRSAPTGDLPDESGEFTTSSIGRAVGAATPAGDTAGGAGGALGGATGAWAPGASGGAFRSREPSSPSTASREAAPETRRSRRRGTSSGVHAADTAGRA